MDFLPLTIDRKDFVREYQRSYTDIILSLADFATTFLWNAAGKVTYAEQDGCLFIRNIYAHKVKVFLPPFCKNHADTDRAFRLLIDHCAQSGEQLLVRGITDYHLGLMSDELKMRLDIKYDRDGSEYVYDINNLIELKSEKALREKANKLARFENSYIYEFRECTVDDYEQIISLASRWSSKGNTAAAEFRAICRMLDNRMELGIKCGVLLVDGALAAFSAGSVMYNGQVQILFEKADTKYYGIYQAINRYMLKEFFGGYKYVNRQEDMGIEGLRQAKKSYCPAFMQDVYTVKLAEQKNSSEMDNEQEQNQKGS